MYRDRYGIHYSNKKRSSGRRTLLVLWLPRWFSGYPRMLLLTLLMELVLGFESHMTHNVGWTCEYNQKKKKKKTGFNC